MLDDTKNYDKATLAFTKLDPNPGDVIVIKFPYDINPKQMEIFGLDLQPHIPEDVAILCTRAGIEIETLSEHQMNEQGWYKFDTNKVN